DAVIGASGPDGALFHTQGGRPLRLLDIGTGGADIPVSLLASWRAAGRALEVTAIDSRSEVIAAARDQVGPASLAGLRVELADGRALPYEAGAFDIAHASLVLHHLEPEEGIALLP